MCADVRHENIISVFTICIHIAYIIYEHDHRRHTNDITMSRVCRRFLYKYALIWPWKFFTIFFTTSI